MPSFDIQGARKAGYADSDIANMLAGKSGFDYQGAKAAGYSDTEIAEKLSGYEPVGVAEDVAKSTLSALPKAAAAAPMWLADVGNLAAKGLAYGAGKIYDATHEQNLTPEQWERLKSVQPFFGSQDVLKGVQEASGVELYQPQTTAGKFADTATQFAIGNKLAGGKAATGAVAGLTSEGAGQLTEGTAAEAPARFIGAIAGGLAADKNSILRSNAGSMAYEATKDLSQTQIDDAAHLIDEAASIGIKLTPAEAIAQITGNQKQPLLSLQRSAEGAPNTAARMGEFMAQRPSQNQAAMDDYLQMGIGESPNYPMIPVQTQKTAEQAVKGVEGRRTMAASPFYAAANSTTVQPQAVGDLVAKIDQSMATAPASVRTQLSGLKNDIVNSGGTVEGLDTVRKLYRDRLETPQIGANAVEKTTAANVSPFLDELNQILEAASPEFAQGKAVYQAMTPEVDAVNASPVGKLARSNPDAQNAIMSQFDDLVRSDSARPQDVAAAVKQLAAVNPEAPQNLISAGLRLEWEKATKGVIPGENQMGAAKFAANVDTEKVRAALGALPGGQDALRGFDVLSEAFQAQGKRLPVGSPTQDKTFLQKQIEKGGVVGSVARPLNTIGEYAADYRTGKANEQLLEVMTSPGGISKLQELAKVGAESPRGKAILRTLMFGARASEMTEDPVQAEPDPEPAEKKTALPPQSSFQSPQSFTAPSKNQQIAALLAQEEGVKPRAYTDTTGNRTIGVGFNMDSPNARKVWDQAGISTPFDSAYAGNSNLSPSEMERLATVSQLIAEDDARRLVPGYDSLPVNKQAALTQMAYQLGGPRMAEFKPTLALINRGEFDEAAARLLQSQYARQTPERVKRIAQLLASN